MMGVYRFKRDQPPRFSVDDHLGNTADSRGNHRRSAGHGLKVDNSKWFIDRGADKESGMAKQTDKIGPGNPLVYPDDLVSGFGSCLPDVFGHLPANGVRIRGACAEHNLYARIEPPDGTDEMRQAFLAGNATHKKDEGAMGVDLVRRQQPRVQCRFILIYIDSVWDHTDLLERDGIEVMDRRFHRGRNGNDAIGVFVGCFLEPGAGLIGRTQLLCLPGPLGLQGMGRDYQRDPEYLLDQATAQGGIPCVAVDDIGLFDRPRHENIPKKGVQ